jgi:hypothetical protein
MSTSKIPATALLAATNSGEKLPTRINNPLVLYSITDAAFHL